MSHALIHTYAREKVQPEAEVVRRLAEYYTALAEAESAKGLEGYARLDEERTHIMRVLAGCVEREQWAAAMKLVMTADRYLDIQGHWVDRLETLKIGLTTANQTDIPLVKASFMGQLANVYSDLGQTQEAIEYYQQGLVIARETKNNALEALMLGSLAVCRRELPKGCRNRQTGQILTKNVLQMNISKPI